MEQRVIALLIIFIVAVGCGKEPENPDVTPVQPSFTDHVLILDSFEGVEMVVVGNSSKDFMMAFKRDLVDGTRLEFEVVQNESPIVMTDEEGNKWDVFGQAVSGPRAGQKLQNVTGYRGYWFAFGTFYPGVEIYGDGPVEVEVDPSLYEPTNDWGVPSASVLNGGPGQDGIPSIDNPIMVSVSESDLLQPDDLIVGVKVGDEIRGYPHPILDWHEIANDQIGDTYYSVIYCPLTGTATVWNRNLNGEVTTYGVSGLLYNTNIIPYDRATGSRWSQILHKGINGTNLDEASEDMIVFETSWETWQTLYPTESVLSAETGFNRNYGNYPYGDYRTNHEQLIFPITYDDDRLDRKERVYGVVINGKAKVYRLDDF